MEKQMSYFWCFVVVICWKLFLSGHAIESPAYTVIHLESDFEIRLYRETSWVSAPVQGSDSFEKATKDGFHRFFSPFGLLTFVLHENINLNID